MLANKDLLLVLPVGLEIAEQSLDCFFAEARLTGALLRGFKYLQSNLLDVGALARVTGVHILPGGEHPVFAFNDLADLLLAAEYVFVLHQESVLEFLPLED